METIIIKFASSLLSRLSRQPSSASTHSSAISDIRQRPNHLTFTTVSVFLVRSTSSRVGRLSASAHLRMPIRCSLSFFRNMDAMPFCDIPGWSETQVWKWHELRKRSEEVKAF